ncbi:hypothetical protein ILUMI_26941 [Ignelater luminosus]|uniref:Tc1-like transposase DDE domain-containing protein n=1 Tax=Ignelater luminosus TaxID=2038154 RepID=A0A8K0C5Q5_IGNLU|nr:hypothetical protein ILUMI_26941 [Ignelater luminosus]
MKRFEKKVFAKSVVQYYLNTAHSDKSTTVKHFMEEGASKPGVNKRRNVSLRERKSLLKMGLSQRKIAARHQISRAMVQRIKSEYNIRTNRCITCPKYTENQKKTAKKLCRKLYESKPNKIRILDDESYIMCDPENIPGQKYYNYTDKASEPYIKVGTFKSQEYLEECLQKRLVPLIDKYHQRRNVLFCPDKAVIHYSRICKNWLEAKGIECVAYAENPTNVSQAQPIERFWAICKRKYSERCRTITALSRFRKIWKDISA